MLQVLKGGSSVVYPSNATAQIPRSSLLHVLDRGALRHGANVDHFVMKRMASQRSGLLVDIEAVSQSGKVAEVLDDTASISFQAYSYSLSHSVTGFL